MYAASRELVGRLCKHCVTGSTHVYLLKHQSHTEAVKDSSHTLAAQHSTHNGNGPVASLSNAIRARQKPNGTMKRRSVF